MVAARSMLNLLNFTTECDQVLGLFVDSCLSEQWYWSINGECQDLPIISVIGNAHVM